jgi:hypothetical protein
MVSCGRAFNFAKYIIYNHFNVGIDLELSINLDIVNKMITDADFFFD